MRTILILFAVAISLIGGTLIVFHIMLQENDQPQSIVKNNNAISDATVIKTQPSPPLNDSAEYVKPDDVLHIWVRNERDLDIKASVQMDGSIYFPLVGSVQGAGRTLSEIKDDIRSSLLRYIINPEVNIVVL